MDTPVGSVEIAVPMNCYLTKRAQNPRNEKGGLPIHPDYGYEPTFVLELDSKLSQETIFYDIGSSYGFFIEVAKICGVDPKNIHAFQGGDSSGQKLRLLSKNHPLINLNQQFVGTKDSMIKLKDYISNHDTPDIVKIDTEGAEFDILRSVGNIGELTADLFIEVHPLLIDASDSVSKMVDFIESGGYTVEWADHRSPNANWKTFDKEYPKPSEMITNSSGPYMIKCEK
jgi:hypothetical protein